MLRGYLVKIPRIIRWFKSDYYWQGPLGDGEGRPVYLTFDDGPSPDCTAFVLEQLERRSQKATFFCLGQQVEKHPKLLKRIVNGGHSIGSHTFSHPKLAAVDHQSYLEEVAKAHELIEAVSGIKTKLFRPPYGKLNQKLSKAIKSQGLRIVLWDVMPGDFDPKRTVNQLLKDTLSNIEPGSIVVLHDSSRCFEVMKQFLPRLLDGLYAKGYKCKSLPQ